MSRASIDDAVAPSGSIRGRPFVSVVIPVFNERKRLGTCLAALQDQSYPRDRYEVIVVDNGSSDGTDGLAAEFPWTRWISEETPGSYAARNSGIAVARGAVIAFTDADCIPAPDWIAKGVAHLLESDRCGLVGGKVDLVWASPGRPTTYELYQALFDFDQQRCVAVGRFALTANLFTHAEVIRHVGAFRAGLKSVGDRDWGNRVAAAGYTRVFSEAASVQHPGLTSMRALLKRRLRVAGGYHDWAHLQRYPYARVLAALSQQLVRKPIRGMRRVWSAAAEITTAQKVKLTGVLVLLCWAEAVELLRLEVSGRSRR